MNKRWLVVSIFVGLGLMLAPPILADFQVGLDAYKRGDYDTALKEFQPLAELGDAEAQFNLGLLYVRGQGVPQDDQEAVRWYRLAADQDFASAQGLLGLMYYEGRGVPQDYTEAVKWYRLAAEQGLAVAQYKLGLMYALGHGLSKDYVLTHMWATLAAAKEVKEAVEVRDIIEKSMTPAQTMEAQRLAREWTAKGE